MTDVGSTFQTAGFYNDPFGIVHLEGTVRRASGTSTFIFELPAGYTPSDSEFFETSGGPESNPRVVEISGAGIVDDVGDTGLISRDGITFRAND